MLLVGACHALSQPLKLLVRTQSKLEAQAGALSTQAMRPTHGQLCSGSLVGPACLHALC